MKRHIHGLSATRQQNDIPNGVYLVRVEQAQYCWHKLKPFYALHFFVLEPKQVFGGSISARIYCSPKTLWRLAWFLRDFRYSQELLEQDEIDVRALIGLKGVIQIVHQVLNGRAEVSLTAFAPAPDWEYLPAKSVLQTEMT